MPDWLHLIDVSHWQGPIDWRAVAASGIRGAWIKATEAAAYRRTGYFLTNAPAARGAGVAVGGYHYAKPGRPTEADALAEADYFANVLAAAGPLTLPPALDLEESPLGETETAAWALTFLRRLEARTGRRPVLYCAHWLLPNDARLATYDLWLPRYTAGYTVDPNPTAIRQAPAPAPWPAWQVWQYTSSGRVPGIAGNVDRNVADRGWFTRVTGTTTPTTPPPPEDPDMPLTDDDLDRIVTAIVPALSGNRIGSPDDVANPELITDLGDVINELRSAEARIRTGTLTAVTLATTRILEAVQTAGPGGTVDAAAIAQAVRAELADALDA